MLDIQGTWHGKPIPQPYESAEPLPPNKLEKLREVMQGYLDARMSKDAELFHVQQKLRSIIADHDQGRTTILTQPWLHVHRDTGLSLADHTAAAVVGGSMTRRIERWREAFTHKKAKNILRHPGGLAEPAAPQRATQRDAGAPRPPSYRDAVHSQDDMREIIIKHYQNVITMNLGHAITEEEAKGHHHVVSTEFIAWKPGDNDHTGKARHVSNLQGVNATMQDLLPKRKAKGGSRTAMKMVQEHDLGSAADFKQGYSQVGVTPKTARLQCHLALYDDWLEALRRAGKPMDKEHHVKWVRGKKCVVTKRTVISQGHTASSDLFTERVGFIQNELSQKAGIRIVPQIDDLSIWTRGGPLANYIDLLITIATVHYFGGILHLTAEKADQLWPSNVVTFDGTVFVPPMMSVFSPIETAARHAHDLLELLSRLENATGLVTLREWAKVTMQQQYHAPRSYPTKYTICWLKQHLAEEHRRLAKEVGLDHCWDQPIQRPTKRILRAAHNLATDKRVGNYMRPVGKRVATVIWDASEEAYGFEVTFKDSEAKLVGSVSMTAEERKLWHTHKELLGGPQIAQAVMQQYDIRGEPARPSVVMLKNDNTAAVKNINKPGKKPQMVEPQIPMIKEAFARNLIIQAEHCGKYYMDILSNVDYNGRKQLHHGEFMLRQQLVEDVLAALRTEADIDLFATRATKRRPQYVSRHPERIEDGAVACNALLLDWEEHPALKGKTLYAFPPPILLTDLAPMLEQADVQLVLIAPLWETTGPFWPTIQHRIHSYAVIPPTTRTYQHPHGTAIPRSRMPSWPLIAVRFCSQAALAEESQQGQLNSPSPIINRGLITNIGVPLASFYSTSEMMELARRTTGQCC